MQEVDGDLDALDKFLTLNVPELASQVHDPPSTQYVRQDDAESTCAPGYERNVYKFKDIESQIDPVFLDSLIDEKDKLPQLHVP